MNAPVLALVLKVLACDMGMTAERAVVTFEIDGTRVLFGSEGDSERTPCELVPDSTVDYRVACNGDSPLDLMTMWIRRGRGEVRDAGGALVARLSNCKLR